MILQIDADGNVYFSHVVIFWPILGAQVSIRDEKDNIPYALEMTHSV